MEEKLDIQLMKIIQEFYSKNHIKINSLYVNTEWVDSRGMTVEDNHSVLLNVDIVTC